MMNKKDQEKLMKLILKAMEVQAELGIEIKVTVGTAIQAAEAQVNEVVQKETKEENPTEPEAAQEPEAQEDNDEKYIKDGTLKKLEGDISEDLADEDQDFINKVCELFDVETLGDLYEEEVNEVYSLLDILIKDQDFIIQNLERITPTQG